MASRPQRIYVNFTHHPKLYIPFASFLPIFLLISFTATCTFPKSMPESISAWKMAGIGLVVCDFIISFMWVWSGSLIKIFVYKILDLGHEPRGEIIKCALYVLNMFFFAFLGKLTKGGAYNPLTVLSSAISGEFSRFLFTVGARIPAQVNLSSVWFHFFHWKCELGFASYCLFGRIETLGKWENSESCFTGFVSSLDWFPVLFGLFLLNNARVARYNL